MNALSVALQGLGFGTFAVATQGLALEAMTQQTPQAPAGGRVIGSPLAWPTYVPVHPCRPRKRRDADLLFLGH